MERKEAIDRISKLEGKDLRKLAETYNVTVFKEGRKNKGWAGHVIERYLGLALNSAQSPNFGSWELKVVPLYYKRNGDLSVKETMAITMIDPVEVCQNDFENSHLYNKLRKMLVVGRIFENKDETSSIIFKVVEFDLKDPNLYQQIKADYEEVQTTIKTKGFGALSGKLGKFIQPRTKGQGHGSTSRAFYARKILVGKILGIS